MRNSQRRAVWMTCLLITTAFATDACGQIQVHVPGEPPQTARVSVSALGGPIRVRTTVGIPDRGSALLGGSSRWVEGRNEFGLAALGKVPYLGRPFDTVGAGRESTIRRVNVGVRIIDLREEEFRQTGVRSR